MIGRGVNHPPLPVTRVCSWVTAAAISKDTVIIFMADPEGQLMKLDCEEGEMSAYPGTDFVEELALYPERDFCVAGTQGHHDPALVQVGHMCLFLLSFSTVRPFFHTFFLSSVFSTCFSSFLWLATTVGSETGGVQGTAPGG